MVACPGCGLPREDELIGLVPCPVCATATGAAQIGSASIAAPSSPSSPASRDPIAGLPADVSQMESREAEHSGGRRSSLWTLAAFLLGTAAGAGGLWAWQWARPLDEHPERASAGPSLAGLVAA